MFLFVSAFPSFPWSLLTCTHPHPSFYRFVTRLITTSCHTFCPDFFCAFALRFFPSHFFSLVSYGFVSFVHILIHSFDGFFVFAYLSFFGCCRTCMHYLFLVLCLYECPPSLDDLEYSSCRFPLPPLPSPCFFVPLL